MSQRLARWRRAVLPPLPWGVNYYRAEASPGWASWAIISIAMAACFVLFENEPAFGMMTRRGCAAHAACSRKSRLKTDLRGVFRYAEGESFAPVSCGQ